MGIAVGADFALAEVEVGTVLIPELDNPGALEALDFGADLFLRGGGKCGELERRATAEFLARELLVDLNGPRPGGRLVLGGGVGFGLDDADGEGCGLGEKG